MVKLANIQLKQFFGSPVKFHFLRYPTILMERLTCIRREAAFPLGHKGACRRGKLYFFKHDVHSSEQIQNSLKPGKANYGYVTILRLYSIDCTVYGYTAFQELCSERVLVGMIPLRLGPRCGECWVRSIQAKRNFSLIFFPKSEKLYIKTSKIISMRLFLQKHFL